MLQYSHLFDLYAGLAPFPARRVHEGSWFLGIPHPRNIQILEVKGDSSNDMLIFGLAKSLGTNWENDLFIFMNATHF